MSTTYLSAFRLFSRDARLYLMTAALFGFTVFGGIYAVLLNLYLLRLGYGPQFVGLINGTGQLAFAIFCLPAGALGRRWGNSFLTFIWIRLYTFRRLASVLCLRLANCWPFQQH